MYRRTQHMELLMENSAPSYAWTYNTRWYRYLVNFIEMNVLKLISCLYVILFCNVVGISCKDNKLIIYLSVYPYDLLYTLA